MSIQSCSAYLRILIEFNGIVGPEFEVVFHFEMELMELGGDNISNSLCGFLFTSTNYSGHFILNFGLYITKTGYKAESQVVRKVASVPPLKLTIEVLGASRIL